MKKINEKIKKALSFLLILTMAMTSVGVSTFSAFADSENGTGTTELNLDTDAENTASDDTVDLAFQTDGHGKFLINGEDKTNQTITVNKGTEVTYEVTADDGYQIQKIRTSYADGTETEVESKESDLTQNVVADQSLTLSAEFAEKQEEDTPATVTTPAPVVVTTPEDDKNTAKEDDTKTSADTTTSSSEENVKYNNRLSDVTADWGENEFLKEHLSASDLIELSNGISLFASRSGKVSAGMDGLNSVATAKKGSIVTKNTPIDGNYYFTPIIGSKTKITFGTTDSNYTWDNEFCKNAQYYSKAISNWWAPQADTTNWSNTRSFIPHDGAQGHLYAEYTNVGYYDGSPQHEDLVLRLAKHKGSG